MKVYLIRHGRTEANEKHLYCGSTDLPLSEGGREELRGLSYGHPDGIYATSGMKRTEETLALLFGDVPHKVIPGLREVDFGSFEMHGYEELKEDPEYQAWITGDNERNVPPGGESGEQMTRRVLDAWNQIMETGEDHILVTHGGVIAALMAHLFPEAGKSRYQWQPKPGQGWLLTKKGTGWAYQLLNSEKCGIANRSIP